MVHNGAGAPEAVGALNPSARADILAALAVSNLPNVHWLQGDDLCDCTFQRIGEWTNPYIAKTLRVRLCCLWAEIYKQYPQFVQDIDAYYDGNRHEWVTEPRAWDSDEADMPLPIWYRQLAVLSGRSVGDIRAEFSQRLDERPRKVLHRVEHTVTEADLASAQLARLRLTGWL